MLRKLFCTTCDPWQAHLYGTEWNPNATRPFAYFCWDYCGSFYHACATEYMYWNNTQSGVHLFGGTTVVIVYARLLFEGSSPYLRDDWSTVEDFCTEFALPQGTNENCFTGVPYEPNPAPKGRATNFTMLTPLAPNDSQPICIEYWSPSSWNPIVTTIQDPNDNTDRMFIVYKVRVAASCSHLSLHFF